MIVVGKIRGPHCNFKTIGIHRQQTPPRYRNATSHASPWYGPLRPNVTSSIRPEVHNIAQCCQRRTELRPQGISTTNFVKIGLAVPEICSRTDRRTDTQTSWSRYSGPLPGRSNQRDKRNDNTALTLQQIMQNSGPRNGTNSMVCITLTNSSTSL